MKKYYLYILISTLIFSFSACELNLKKNGSKYKDNDAKYEAYYNFITGQNYRKKLASNFESCSDSESVRYDFCNLYNMKQKAKKLLAGQNISITNPYNLWLHDSSRNEIIAAWEFLSFILKTGNTSQTNLANLHFYYECWIDQTIGQNNGFYSTTCKNQFIRLMNQIINKCKTNFLVEFSPKSLEDNDLSGLAIDSNAQAVIYSFLKTFNDSSVKNNFLIVGKKEYAIKVANFMNIQAGIEKNRLKIILSDKIESGYIGLFLDNNDSRFCFSNSHKKSNFASNLNKSTDDHAKATTIIHEYTDHNLISEEKKQENKTLEKTDNETKNNTAISKKDANESNEQEPKDKPVTNIKNNRIVERVK
jgi:hypothetical protein